MTVTRNRLLVAALLAVLVATAGGFVTSAHSGSPPRSASGLPFIRGPKASALKKGGVNSVCAYFISTYGVQCYGPSDLARAYDFPRNLDGSGSTIVVVDAYGDPAIQADLDAFDADTHTPNTTVQVIHGPSTGATDGSGDLTGWSAETALDVEYAHAMAPGAHIVLAVAATDDDDDFNAAEAAILPKFPGAIVTQSFGGDETDPTAASADQRSHAIFVGATLLGDTILAAAGDYGATDCFPGNTNCDPATPVASFPASDPLVTAVGGTQGNPYDSGLLQHGHYGGEAVWNEPAFDSATGGAPSVLFTAPRFQQPFSHSKQRIVPDVSYDGAIQGGVEEIFTDPVDQTQYIALTGGTSVGTPQWGAIFALANQARAQRHLGPIGYANDNLYRIASDPRSYAQDFHDITVGDNKLDETQFGYSAGMGYDYASGLGTPNVANLVGDLASVQPGGNPGFGGPGSFPKGFGRGSHGRPHTMQPGR